MHLSKPEKPIIVSFRNIPGNNFRKKMNFGTFLSIPFFILINVTIMLVLFLHHTWEVKVPLLMFILVISLFIYIFKDYHDNYIYEEISPGQYRAVLKGKGIGKLSKEEKLSLLQEVLENKREVEIPVKVPKKLIPRSVYVVIFLVILGAMYWAPIKRDLDCKIINETQIYKCEIHSKSVLRHLDTIDLGVIKSAFVANKHDKNSGNSYQIQFRTANNTNVSYTEWWLLALDFILDKKVNAMNKSFSQGKDFHYDFGIGLGLFWIFAIVFPIILLDAVRKGQKQINDYILAPVITPERYKAILKAEGLDNPQEMQFENTLAEVKDEKVINHLKDDDLTDMQKEFYDNSWSAKDQAKREQDVENATKQFYEDGK